MASLMIMLSIHGPIIDQDSDAPVPAEVERILRNFLALI